MKIFNYISIVGILLLFLLFFRENGIFMGENRIPYSDIETINWDSFKGFPDYYSGYGAAIYSWFDYELDRDSNSILVTSFMSPFKSYVLHPELPRPLLLKHELYHFRITELFARKFERQLSDFKRIPEAKALDSLQQLIFKERDFVQSVFDDDVVHGQDTLLQRSWFDYIDKLLEITQFLNQEKESRDSVVPEVFSEMLPIKPTLAYLFETILTKNTVRLQLTYNDKGRISSEVIYRNGKLDGYYLDWYDNQALHRLIRYENGARNGLSVTFDLNGDTLEKFSYVDNVLIE